jgi:predicted RecA/RadA family phage recombinase
MEAIYRYGNVTTVPYTPDSAVSAGEVVIQGSSLVGIAIEDIAASVQGGLAITGVFEFTKNASETITVGERMYWIEADDEATETEGTNIYLGRATEASASTATVVRINIEPPDAPAGS